MVFLSAKIRLHKTLPSAYTKINNTVAFIYLKEVKENEINIFNNFIEEENFFMQKVIFDILKLLTNFKFKITVILTDSNYALLAVISSLLQALYDFNIPLKKYYKIGGNRESLYLYDDDEIIYKHIINEENDILHEKLNKIIEKNINETIFLQ